MGRKSLAFKRSQSGRIDRQKNNQRLGKNYQSKQSARADSFSTWKKSERKRNGKGPKSTRMDSELKKKSLQASSSRQPNSRTEKNSNKSIEVSSRTAAKAIARTLFAAQGSLLFPRSKLRPLPIPSSQLLQLAKIFFYSRAGNSNSTKTSRLDPSLA